MEKESDRKMDRRDSEKYIQEITRPATYEYEGRRYIVTPHFNKEGKNTLAMTILKLMKQDIEKMRL